MKREPTEARLDGESWIDTRLSSIWMMSDPPEPEPEPSPTPEPEPVPEPSPEPEPEPTPAAATDWRDRRIATLTARLREAQRTQATAPAPDPTAAGTITTTQEELDQLVRQRSSETAAVDDFNRRCNEAASTGRTAFSDFDTRIDSLKSLASGGDAQELMRYNQLLLAAIETGEGPKLLHRLGGNLNEASRLMERSSIRMGIEMARMAASPAGEPSNTPRPIRPISASTGGNTRIDPGDPEHSDALSTREWMQRREAQVTAQNKR